MNHHKTNSLRLQFLVNELRAYLLELRAHAKSIKDKQPKSHLALCLERQAEMFNGFMMLTVKNMEKIEWTEPE